MPRRQNLLNMLHEYNALVPQAQALGVRVRPLAAMRMSRAAAAARLDWLRNQIAPFSAPVAAVSGTEQTYGVELEFYMPVGLTREALATSITAAGVPCHAETYNHAARDYWKIVTDGSLGNYVTGSELVSPILTGERGFEQLRIVCGILTAAGCKVSKRCGLHVHVGARNRSLVFLKNLVKMYAKYEAAIDTIVSRSRRGAMNTFCQPVRYDSRLLEAANCVAELQRDTNFRQRYRKLNLDAYWRHGTVEFRQHQGTVEAQKAEMWVRFCLKMAAAAAKEVQEEVSVAADLFTLFRAIDLSEAEQRYFVERAVWFARVDRRAA